MSTTLVHPETKQPGWAAHDARYGARAFTGPVLEEPGVYDSLNRLQRDALSLIENSVRMQGVSVISLDYAAKVLRVGKDRVLRVLDELQSRRILLAVPFTHTEARSTLRGCSVTPGGHKITLGQKPMHCVAAKPWSQASDLPPRIRHIVADMLILEGRA